MVDPQNTPLYHIAAEASIRAVKQCAPFQLPPDKYAAWSTVTWAFDWPVILGLVQRWMLQLRSSTISSPQTGEGFDAMRDDTDRMATSSALTRTVRARARRCCARAAASSLVRRRRPLAQRPDDSYKGPSTGGGLDSADAPVRAGAAAARRRAGGAAAAGGAGGRRRTAGARRRRARSRRSRSRFRSSSAHDPKLAADIADVVAADLERSGLFQPLDRGLVSRAGARRQRRAALSRLALDPRRRARRRRRRRAAPTAASSPSSGCGTSRPASSSPASGSPRAAQNWRRVGHIIADQVYER